MPVVCYICGREFGTKSIGIHIPNCEKKWNNEQKKLPKSQRRPPPSRPDQFDRILKGDVSREEMQKINEQAFEDFNTKALDGCPNCGRTFLPKALEIHLRSCKPKEEQTHAAPKKKAAPKVNYPKFKKKSVSKAEPEKEPSPPSQRRATMEEDPRRDDLINLLKGDRSFDAVENRVKLLQFMKELSVQDELYNTKS